MAKLKGFAYKQISVRESHLEITFTSLSLVKHALREVKYNKKGGL